MNEQLQVALLIETSSTYGRQLLRGVQRFIHAETNRQWLAVIEEQSLEAGVSRWFEEWTGDGMISRFTTDALKQEVKNKHIAFVDLTDRKGECDSVSVRSDDQEIGRLAAEHLAERGFRHFAFCGFRDEAWSSRRLSGFQQFLQTDDHRRCFTFHSSWYGQQVQPWDKEKANLIDWLEQLPKPIGIMACNDIRGKQIVDCCHQAGIEVPDQVAVIGVDNDELLCNFCHTPMTSVMPNAEGIGYKSAELLNELMNAGDDGPVSPMEILVPPLGIVVRQSTDIVAIDDECLAQALRYIRRHACDGITVADVVEHCDLSRSTLERRTRALLGRSPQQEIRRVQLKQVCLMLSETDLPIESIAVQCGFEHPEYLHVVFKREMQITPGEFRSRSGIKKAE